MKKIFIIAILSCVNIFAWGQTEKGKEMLKDAESGDARSQYLLASYYERAREGFEKDETKALEWYTKAGEQNYISSIYSLRSVYEFGKLGQAKDSKKVIYWTKKGAEVGDNICMTELGYYYKLGKHGLEKNENEFLKWTTKAADNNSVNALYQLGAFHKEKGNKDEAIKWLKKCADVTYEYEKRSHTLSIRDLNALGVNYDPSKNNNQNTIDPEDGQVVLYDRLGRVNLTCKLYKEGNQYKVKVDNRLYPLKVYNKKINGVLYTYYCQLFDAENYVKEDADLPTPDAARSTSAKSSKSSTATKSSKSSSAAKSSSATKSSVYNKETKSEESPSSKINDKLNEKVKSLKKKILK